MSSILYAAAIDLALQWGGWLHSVLTHSEKYYDALGAISHILTVSTTYYLSDHHPKQKMISSMIGLWAARLGIFLFYRIQKAGEDSRFAKLRDSPSAMFKMWTGQAVWVLLAGLPAHFVNTNPNSRFNLISPTSLSSLPIADLLGLLLFFLGFLFETISDQQKLTFRSLPENKDRFIQTGLWALSRHPNYFGEITLQLGIYLYSFTSLDTPWKKLLAALSPLFTTFLLLNVTGIPLLEKQALKRWGSNPDYLKYLDNTALLIPYLY